MENTAVDKSALGTPPEAQSRAEKIVEFKRQKTLLKAGALQDAIFNSARFSSIATDEKGVIQIFNVGAERMLGYQAAEVVNKIRPSDIHDPQEVQERAEALSAELGRASKRASRRSLSRPRAASRTSMS